MTKFMDVAAEEVGIRTRQRQDGSTLEVVLEASDRGTDWQVMSVDNTDTIQIRKTVGESSYFLYMGPDEWELVQDMVKIAESRIERRPTK